MKEIPLTQGKVAIVDDEDFEYLNQWKWFYAEGYALRRVAGLRGKQVRMHREILRTPLGLETDHINGNGLDNRKINLRICSNKQNQGNRKIGQNNTTGCKGIWYDPKRKKHWRAAIKTNMHTKTIGYFSTAEEAAIAYDNMAKEFFGEFARTNSEAVQVRML